MIQKLENLDWLVKTYNLLKGGIKVIIKNVTISIKDGKASLNDKIILYQQDKGIEIYFKFILKGVKAPMIIIIVTF